MKKITIFMCVIFMALALNAQEKKMFIHQKGGGVAEYTVANVDSITFGVSDTEQGVWINGVCWATRNVNKHGFFTAKPLDFGMLYGWNKKLGWSTTDPIFNSNNEHTWKPYTYPPPDCYSWENSNNPCPAGWRVPTKEEFDNFISAAWVEEKVIDGIYVQVFSFGGQNLFLPNAGYRNGTTGVLNSVNWSAYYWSGTAYPESDQAYHVNFQIVSGPDTQLEDKKFHYPVRCVKE